MSGSLSQRERPDINFHLFGLGHICYCMVCLPQGIEAVNGQKIFGLGRYPDIREETLFFLNMQKLPESQWLKIQEKCGIYETGVLPINIVVSYSFSIHSSVKHMAENLHEFSNILTYIYVTYIFYVWSLTCQSTPLLLLHWVPEALENTEGLSQPSRS